jgi:ABC-type uncharacterized transport system permease subunit
MRSVEIRAGGSQRSGVWVQVGVTVTEKLMRALGAVVLTCIAVVVLAPLVLRVLPVLLLLGLVAWLVAQLIGWSRFKGY